MELKDLPYPLRLCVEMMHYCSWSNEKTQDMKPSELYAKLGEFFTEEQIQESRKILRSEK